LRAGSGFFKRFSVSLQKNKRKNGKFYYKAWRFKRQLAVFLWFFAKKAKIFFISLRL